MTFERVRRAASPALAVLVFVGTCVASAEGASPPPFPVPDLCADSPTSDERVALRIEPIEVRPVRFGPVLSNRPIGGPPLNVLAAVAQRRSGLAACFHGLHAEKRVPSSVEVSATLDPWGRPRDLVVRSEVEGGTALAACVRDHLARSRLGPPRLRLTRFRILLAFGPEAGEVAAASTARAPNPRPHRTTCLPAPAGQLPIDDFESRVLWRVTGEADAFPGRESIPVPGNLPDRTGSISTCAPDWAGSLRESLAFNQGAFNRCVADGPRFPARAVVRLRSRIDAAGWLTDVKVLSTGGAPSNVVSCLLRETGRIRRHEAGTWSERWPRVEAEIGFLLMPPEPALPEVRSSLGDDELVSVGRAHLGAGDGEGASLAFDVLLERSHAPVRSTCDWLAMRIQAERSRAPWIELEPHLALADRVRSVLAGSDPADPHVSECRHRAFAGLVASAYDLYRLALGPVAVRDSADVAPLLLAALSVAPESPRIAEHRFDFAEILALLGHYDTAIREYEEVVRIVPGTRTAERARDALEEARRRPPVRAASGRERCSP